MNNPYVDWPGPSVPPDGELKKPLIINPHGGAIYLQQTGVNSTFSIFPSITKHLVEDLSTIVYVHDLLQIPTKPQENVMQAAEERSESLGLKKKKD